MFVFDLFRSQTLKEADIYQFPDTGSKSKVATPAALAKVVDAARVDIDRSKRKKSSMSTMNFSATPGENLRWWLALTLGKSGKDLIDRGETDPEAMAQAMLKSQNNLYRNIASGKIRLKNQELDDINTLKDFHTASMIRWEDLDDTQKKELRYIASKLISAFGSSSPSPEPKDVAEGVAGPENCWKGYRKVGTKPGTGRNAGKRVNDCEKIKEDDIAEGVDPLKNREDYAKMHKQGQVYKKTYPGDKVGMSRSYAYDIKRTGPKGKLPKEESVAEGTGDTKTEVKDKYKGWQFKTETQTEDDRYVTFYSATGPDGKEHRLPKGTTTDQFRQFVDSKSVKENVGSTQGQPRIRKYSKMRPDGSKAVRYEVLDYQGRRVSGQGTEGFDDLDSAKGFFKNNYHRLVNPIGEEALHKKEKTKDKTDPDHPNKKMLESKKKYWCTTDKRWKDAKEAEQGVQ